MACGSGQLLADQIAGRKTSISADGLGPERYARTRPTLPGRPLHPRPAHRAAH
jgi:glycine/D-amino acid oxidase-like deaminating enzyme